MVCVQKKCHTVHSKYSRNSMSNMIVRRCEKFCACIYCILLLTTYYLKNKTNIKRHIICNNKTAVCCILYSILHKSLAFCHSNQSRERFKMQKIKYIVGSHVVSDSVITPVMEDQVERIAVWDIVS